MLLTDRHNTTKNITYLAEDFFFFKSKKNVFKNSHEYEWWTNYEVELKTVLLLKMKVL